jgi:two-component system nitrate/nitrite response regulator NarL
MFGEALAAALEQFGRHHVIACTTSITEAAAVLAAHSVDVCVLDVRLQNESGIDGIDRLRAASPSTKTVMLSALADRSTVCQALAAGATGYACKTGDVHAILEVIDQVASGHLVVDGCASPDTEAHQSGTDHSLARYLTRRERQVLDGLVRGQSTTELARELGVRHATARSHVQNVLMKLGVHSQLQAVAYATAHGLVKPPPQAD